MALVHLLVAFFCVLVSAKVIDANFMRREKRRKVMVMTTGSIKVQQNTGPAVSLNDGSPIELDPDNPDAPITTTTLVSQASFSLDWDALRVDTEDVDVAELLRDAHANLVSQIEEQTQAKKDTLKLVKLKKREKKQAEGKLKKLERKSYKKVCPPSTCLCSRCTLGDTAETLASEISELEALSDNQQSNIDDLATNRNAKLKAAKIAEKTEKKIAKLDEQIGTQEALRSSTLTTNAASLAAAQQEGENKILMFTDTIANLSTAINAAQDEYDMLNETVLPSSLLSQSTSAKLSLLQYRSSEAKPHPLHQALEDAKAAIRKVIMQHDGTITTLQAAIDINVDEAADKQEEKALAVKKYDDALQGLADAKTQLEADQGVAKTKKEAAESDLETTTGEGEAEIAKLMATLRSSIDSLKEERTATEASRTAQIDTNAAHMEILLNNHNDVISQITAAIERLKGSRNTSQEVLEKLKKQHLEEGVTDAEEATPSVEA